jgi:Glycosyl transferase family 41/Biotin-lipoyl like
MRSAAIAGWAIIVIFFGGFGAWAVTAPLHGAVVANGFVRVEGNRKSIQHLDGGIVKELNVKEGDRVKAGDVLIVLDDTQARAAAARGVGPGRLVFAPRITSIPEALPTVRRRMRIEGQRVEEQISQPMPRQMIFELCMGNAFAGRVAASLLNAIGLPELVAHSIEDYETLALRLAKEPSLLEGYRNRLATNRLTHPLFDTDRFRRHIEAAYLQMWEIWQRGEQPRSLGRDTERGASPFGFAGTAGGFRFLLGFLVGGRYFFHSPKTFFWKEGLETSVHPGKLRGLCGVPARQKRTPIKNMRSKSASKHNSQRMRPR